MKYESNIAILQNVVKIIFLDVLEFHILVLFSNTFKIHFFLNENALMNWLIEIVQSDLITYNFATIPNGRL